MVTGITENPLSPCSPHVGTHLFTVQYFPLHPKIEGEWATIMTGKTHRDCPRIKEDKVRLTRYSSTVYGPITFGLYGETGRIQLRYKEVPGIKLTVTLSDDTTFADH